MRGRSWHLGPLPRGATFEVGDCVAYRLPWRACRVVELWQPNPSDAHWDRFRVAFLDGGWEWAAASDLLLNVSIIDGLALIAAVEIDL